MQKKSSRSVFATTKEKTFAKDDTLPPLPVPDLKKTIDKYLESVKPHVDGAAYKKTERIARDFENGVAKTLHQKLLEKAKKEKNWVSKYWDTYAYLTLREPLIPYYSMGGAWDRGAVPWPKGATMPQQAALYTYFLMEFWQLLKNQQYVPHRSVDGRPFSMANFRNLFNTGRAAGEHVDAIRSHFTTDDSCPSHLVVMCRGRFFVFDVMSGHSGLLTPPELEVQFERILEACISDGDGVATLTCDNRPQWAKNKNWLMQISSNNRKILDLIESAITIIAMETDEGIFDQEAGLRYSLGGGNLANHWVDKSMAITTFPCGSVTSLCDHAAYDGMVSISSFIYVQHAIEEMNGQWIGDRKVLQNMKAPVEITFDVDSIIKSEIARVSREAEAVKNPVCVTRKAFDGYGKRFMQTQKLHPDAWIQLAIQLAFYKIHNKFAPMYETATTRQYFEGRTETVRSCSLEAVAWISEMAKQNPNLQNCKALFISAVNKHNAMMKEARNGFGCDRHLFGLQCLAFENDIPTPEIFTDPSWKLSGGSGNFYLSTSLLGYQPNGGTVAPMCLDGYGCFYNILNDQVFISISAWKASTETSSEKLFFQFEAALDQIQKVLLSGAAKM
ncbi:peroxisomal carnitine O-octanoyltransferase [Neocloeon triangulifer]|uniref:peroxisomal carnitine O-octanoyltransferase n=1 Tax=Neocloeon triangulifer TaxID=2078957 RepID=UPI00286EFC76|nr:peroxisomal carnitine O-octanoyltransferase [Neocloeon triangulifer]XP_059489008.1 peroxisomal carnitine O-octanoyltransferase [Neocloeon triangulifer]XP_059489009.1 peroxisomal carnitine O-octanoyltransferase [Neocloeon triangulifer]XP_059489010.1 peroxisomal carnitine O-octanoyltransferase [Neocloeon triangulifer]